MSFTTVPSVVTGQTYSAANWNTYVKDNINTIWVYTTAGDIAYAVNATTLARLELVVGGILVGGASAPEWLAPGAAGQYVGITAGVPAWKDDGVPGAFTAAGDIVYGSAADTSAVLNKPSASGLLKETSAGVPSWKSIYQTTQIQIVPETGDLDTSTGIAYFRVPSTFNGMNLVRAIAFVGTAGTTNATTVQVRNMTKYASNDALSGAISIASGDTVATAGTVNTSYDDVATNDLIKVYVTGQSTTKPKGLWVVLEFQLP